MHKGARMRPTITILFLLAFMVSPAYAKARKHAAKPKPPAPAQVVHDDRTAQEHARAEQQLSDLRTGKDAATPAQPEPDIAGVQAQDSEVPSNLRTRGSR
jgi:hypothetical protein